jgi:hypothetical protein
MNIATASCLLTLVTTSTCFALTGSNAPTHTAFLEEEDNKHKKEQKMAQYDSSSGSGSGSLPF